MCIDYVMKWVEAREVPREMQKVVVDFIFSDICVIFGVPREFFTNQGTYLVSMLMSRIVHKY